MSENKESLLDFLSESWSSDSLCGTAQLFLSGGFKDQTKTVVITKYGVEAVPALYSIQEEADTRIILHTFYTALGYWMQRWLLYMQMTHMSLSSAYIIATETQPLNNGGSE